MCGVHIVGNEMKWFTFCVTLQIEGITCHCIASAPKCPKSGKDDGTFLRGGSVELHRTESEGSLDLQPADIKSRWKHNGKSAQVVISHLVSDLSRQHWCLRNHFCTEQGHCGACRRKWRLADTDLCPCSENQTMSHVVESCPLRVKCRLHSADEYAVSWLTNYGSWHAYEKKKKSKKDSCCKPSMTVVSLPML